MNTWLIKIIEFGSLFCTSGHTFISNINRLSANCWDRGTLFIDQVLLESSILGVLILVHTFPDHSTLHQNKAVFTNY